MNRTVISVIALPLAATVAIGGVLLASHHTAVPRLTPGPVSSQPVARTVACKDATPATPFVGIAINPRIQPHVLSFQQATGTQVSVVEFYNRFQQHFQFSEAAQAVALGKLPLIQLDPRQPKGSTAFVTAQIAEGHWDSHIRQYAEAVKKFRCEVALSFGHEMNGWWYPWGHCAVHFPGCPQPGVRPATFKAAWKRIHDIFAALGVTNVIWCWDPTHQYRHSGATLASQWYPGDKYVDWIGIDGYLGSGDNFATIFARQLRNIRRVAHRPIFLAETGVDGKHNPSQVRQINGMFAAVKRFGLIGLVWFELNRKQNWKLQGRPAAIAAFKNDAASTK